MIPHSAAGCLIDPPVSVPVEIEVIFAATHAAEPPELPPGTRLSFQGLPTGPKKLVSFDEPIANSSIFVFAIITEPASSQFLVTVELYGGIKFESIFDPQVV